MKWNGMEWNGMEWNGMHGINIISVLYKNEYKSGIAAAAAQAEWRA